MRIIKRLGRFVFSWRGLLVLLAVAGGVAWATWPDDKNLREWSRHYDVDAAPADLIPPGTVVPDGAPPEGWSRTVIKSKPRVAPEDREKVSSLAVRKAEMQFAAFLADVGPEEGTSPPRHRLKKLGIGMGRRVKDQDVILSPDTADRLGADLDIIDRQVLRTSFERQQGGRVLVRSEAFALVDCPVPFRCGERNRMVAFRYALVVDDATGRLDVLNWWVDHSGQCARGDAGAAMVLLPPQLLNEPNLYVDTKEFNLLGIPSDVGMAVNRLPPAGKPVTVPPELTALAMQPAFSPDEARRLEADLRRLLEATPDRP